MYVYIQSRPGDAVCPSVCQFTYFQNLISAAHNISFRNDIFTRIRAQR